MNNLKLTLIYILLIVMPVLVLDYGQAEEAPKPYFDDEVYVSPGDVLSPQGTYIASASRINEDNTITINLWSNPGFQTTATHIPQELMWSAVIELSGLPERVRPELVFSPDERYLAVRGENNLMLFTVPDLESYTELPQQISSNAPSRRITWSLDGMLLAFRMPGTTFAVWNIETDEIYRNLVYHYGQIIALKDGWLIGGTSGTTFWTCTLMVEECNRHSVSGTAPAGLRYSVRAAASGQTVIISWWIHEDEPSSWIWRQQGDGSYYLIDEPLVDAELCFLGLSSISDDGQYFVTCHATSTLRIWNINTLEVIQEIATGYCDLTKFIPESNYLITFCGLTLGLYHVGEDKPLDVMDLSNIPDIGEAIIGDPIDISIEGISQNGRWVLVNMGNGKLLVSIQY